MNKTEYLLSKLIEECAEVIQRCTKAQCFGLHEVQEDQPLNNEDRIKYEIADMIGTCEYIQNELGILDEPNNLEFLIEEKIKKLRKYSDYSKQVGTLTED